MRLIDELAKANAAPMFGWCLRRSFDEGQHPRGDNGRFADAGGGDQQHALDGWINGSTTSSIQDADQGHSTGSMLGDKEHEAFTSLLNSMPQYSGMAYRSLFLEDKTLAELGVREGKDLQFKFNQSASKDEETAKFFANDKADQAKLTGLSGAKVLFAIQSKTSADLNGSAYYRHSEWAYQKEVVLRPDAKYEVRAVGKWTGGFTRVFLTEK